MLKARVSDWFPAGKFFRTYQLFPNLPAFFEPTWFLSDWLQKPKFTCSYVAYPFVCLNLLNNNGKQNLYYRYLLDLYTFQNIFGLKTSQKLSKKKRETVD